MNFPSRVIIFDMDGTLTVPTLDFDRMRDEIGIADGSLLEAMETMSPAEKARAEEIVHRHEADAAASSILQPGAKEVVAAIRNFGFPVALMTRNTRVSVRAFQDRHGITFDLIRTREDGVCKPSPQPVHEICGTLGGRPADAWVIGDFHYDILCGNAAGATTVLMWSESDPLPEWSGEANHVIRKLGEMLSLLGLA
jgi:HAD superfamily hydrolase (TIGR01509 family)